MSIEKRGEGTWRIKLYMGRGGDGKIQYYSETYHAPLKSMAEARERELNEKIKGLKNGPVSDRMYLSQYMSHYVSTRKNWASSTRRCYVDYARQLEPYTSRTLLWSLNSERLEAIMAAFMADREITQRSAKNIYAFLRSVVNRAIREKKAPQDALLTFEVPTEPPKHRDFYTRDDLVALVEAAKSYRYGLYFRLLAESGARPGEILGLKWDMVDFADGSIIIDRTGDVHSPVIFDQPKTDNSRRTVLFSPETMERLREHYIEQQREQKIAVIGRGIDATPVFLSQEGRRVSYSMMQKTFSRACAKAGIKLLRMHDIRGSVATNLLIEGRSIIDVASLLGDTVDTVARRYARRLRRSRAFSLSSDSQKNPKISETCTNSGL